MEGTRSDAHASAQRLSLAALRSGKGAGDENFPVASLLVAKRHRPAIRAFYDFARIADDVADHPSAAPEEKLELLDSLRADLLGEAGGAGTDDARPGGAEAAALRHALAERGLGPEHPLALIEAFRQDVRVSRYGGWKDLMDYCALSAAPVGRFVLDVHGESRDLWRANDALCAALQVINHIQDCGADLASLDRCYIPASDMADAGASLEMLRRPSAAPELRRCLGAMLDRTSALLDAADPFAGAIRSRGLALEVAVIQALARRLVGRLRSGDVLAGHIRLSKAAAAGVAASAVWSALWRGRDAAAFSRKAA